MTREIIETILGIENKAEDIIVQARGISQNLQIDTDKQLSEMNAKFKDELRILKEQTKNEIEDKSLKEQEKIAKALQKEQEKIAEQAKKNTNSVKQLLLERIIQ